MSSQTLVSENWLPAYSISWNSHFLCSFDKSSWREELFFILTYGFFRESSVQFYMPWWSSKSMGQRLPTSWQTRSREWQGPETMYNLQRHAHSNPLPPSKPYLLKSPQPPKTVPQTGTKCSTHESVGDISYSYQNILPQTPKIHGHLLRWNSSILSLWITKVLTVPTLFKSPTSKLTSKTQGKMLA
jgi:hypothetical protein